MPYWLIADTHFAPHDLRGFNRTLAKRQEKLWSRLALIPAEDTLVHLGDFCVLDDDAMHARLKREVRCTRILVRGNHDLEPIQWYLAHGWHFVCDGLHLEYRKHRLLFTHKPAYPDRECFTRNIHGHTHGLLQRGRRFGEEYQQWYAKGYHINISPELVGYRPIRLDNLLKKLSSKRT
jgi:calcineurin-like phosphoesterase family protein